MAQELTPADIAQLIRDNPDATLVFMDQGGYVWWGDVDRHGVPILEGTASAQHPDDFGQTTRAYMNRFYPEDATGYGPFMVIHPKAPGDAGADWADAERNGQWKTPEQLARKLTQMTWDELVDWSGNALTVAQAHQDIQVALMTTCVDPETRARLVNEGHELAMAQMAAPDERVTDAEDWLEDQRAQAWDAGHQSGFWNGRESSGHTHMEAVGIEHAKANNPHRHDTPPEPEPTVEDGRVTHTPGKCNAPGGEDGGVCIMDPGHAPMDHFGADHSNWPARSDETPTPDAGFIPFTDEQRDAGRKPGDTDQ